MTLLFKIALRNLRRNARRNVFTILSIGFGLGFLFWIQCILTGHNANMIRTVTSTFTGSVQIHAADYLEERQASMFFSPSIRLRNQLDTLGEPWAQRVYFPAIISSGALSYPLVLVGIEGSKEKQIINLFGDMTDGEFVPDDAECSQPRVLVSNRLAQKLDVEVGDKLVMLGQDATGSLGNDLFRVSGLYTSTSNDFDKRYVFSSLACVQKIAAIGGVHEIVIKTASEMGVLNSLQASMDPQIEVSTWRNLVPGVASMIRFNSAMSNVITFILFTVITLGVVNSILMNIFERIREFGIMLALGTTPVQVRVIILVESILMALTGAFVGTVIGLVVVLYHQRVPFDLAPFLGNDGASKVGFSFETHVKPMIDWSQYLWLVGVEIIFISLSGLYPAVKASRLKPADTIRGGV
jgi:putative ABC transport system permease protein